MIDCHRSISSFNPNKRRRMMPPVHQDSRDGFLGQSDHGEIDKLSLEKPKKDVPAFRLLHCPQPLDLDSPHQQETWDTSFLPLQESSDMDAMSVDSLDDPLSLLEDPDTLPYPNPSKNASEEMQVFDVCMDDRMKERKFMMDVLGGAPTHQLGRFSLVSRLEWSLPLTALTRILKNSHLLTYLSLQSVAFEGSKPDFDRFCDCLRFHPSLKEVHMVDCCLVDQSLTIDPLLEALAVIPTLETVEIYAMDLERETPSSLMSSSALAILCRSHSIKTLILEDLDLTENHVHEVANALKHNDVMTRLTLWDCNISDQGGKELSEMLKVNTRLEKLDLSFNELSNVAFTALAHALRINKTLGSLSLHSNCSQFRRKAQGTRTIVPKSCTKSSKGYAALLETLENHNQVLEELILDTEEDPRITLCLAVNRNRFLLKDDNISRLQLADCLSDYNGADGRNLSFVYYMLQANPELCEVNR